jgi:acyl-CoA thioester hydrolase
MRCTYFTDRSMNLSDFAFTHSVRVRYSEADMQGVVFNARYLDYADIAITEYWRAVGFRTLYPGDPLEFHVARAVVNFRKPILADEIIIVAARTIATGRTSLTQQVAIFGTSSNDDLRAEIDLVNVHVDLADHRPVPLPDWLPRHFAEFDKKTA